MAREQSSALRRGWTTGACAAAASRAAFAGMLGGCFPDPVSIRLPRGGTATFPVALAERNSGSARVGIVKDAGDDPDITHGALIIGETAINPAPRALIRDTLIETAAEIGVPPPDLTVTISIPGGDRLAQKTLNARLGIMGGLSILGTTGIVVPYSCSSWIHSIHRGIDIARAAGLRHIAASTGSTSERAVQRLYSLPDHAL